MKINPYILLDMIRCNKEYFGISKSFKVKWVQILDVVGDCIYVVVDNNRGSFVILDIGLIDYLLFKKNKRLDFDW